MFMKKYLAWLLVWLVGLGWLFTSANGIWDDFSTATTVNGGSGISSNTEAKKTDVFNYVGVMWASLMKTVFDNVTYSLCITTTASNGWTVFKYNPWTCHPKGTNTTNLKWPQPVWQIMIKDVMDWKYELGKTLNMVGILLGLVFAIVVMVSIFITKAGTDEGMTVGKWIIQKFQKEKSNDEQDKNRWQNIAYIIIFGLFIFFTSNVLSAGLENSIRTDFDQGLASPLNLLLVAIAFILALVAYVLIIVTLTKTALLPYIESDLAKDEEESSIKSFVKLIAFSLGLLLVAYFLFSNVIVKMLAAFI